MSYGRTALLLSLVVICAACGLREVIPPASLPLVPTPAAAVPGPPETDAPSAPFRLRLVRRRLENGLTLFVAPGRRDGVVSLAFVSRAVGQWEARTPEPVTAMMVDTLFRATRLEDGTVAEEWLASRGFHPRVELTSDAVILTERVLSDEVADYTRMLARSLREPVYRENDLALAMNTRAERLAGLRQSSEGAVDELLPALLYASEDPRAASFERRVEVLRAMTTEQLVARHRDLLDPSRAAVIVAGDVDPGAVMPRLLSAFGGWPSRPVEPQISAPRLRESTAAARVGIVQPLVRSYVKVLERAPPLGHEDHAAFLLLEQLLGRMFGAHLNLTLREREGISYGFHARYTSDGESGEVQLATVVDNEHAARAVGAIARELARVRGDHGGIEPFELELARTRARAALLGELDTTRGLVSWVGRCVATGAEPSLLTETLSRIDRLDRSSVEAAARRWIRAAAAPLVVVGSRAVLEEVRRNDGGAMQLIPAPARTRR